MTLPTVKTQQKIAFLTQAMSFLLLVKKNRRYIWNIKYIIAHFMTGLFVCLLGFKGATTTKVIMRPHFMTGVPV